VRDEKWREKGEWGRKKLNEMMIMMEIPTPASLLKWENSKIITSVI
jgi:hypothetical protein